MSQAVLQKRLYISLFSIIISLLYFQDHWLAIFSGEDTTIALTQYNFRSNTWDTPQDSFAIIQNNGWTKTTQGLALAPNTTGTLELTINIPKKAQDLSIGMQTWFSDFLDLDTKIFIYSPTYGKKYYLGKNCFSSGKLLFLSPYLHKDDSHFNLIFEVSYHTRIRQSPYVCLKQLLIYFGGIRASPQIPYSICLAIIPILILILANVYNLPYMSSSMIGILSSVLAWIWYFYNPPSQSILIITIVLLVIYGLKTQSQNCFLTVFILIGAYLRWDYFLINQLNALSADAKDFADIANNLAHPYDTQIREPLYPWILYVFQIVFGGKYISTQLSSFSFSVLLIFVSFYISKKYLTVPLALLVSACIAVNPWLIHQSIRGLRSELYTCLVLWTSYYLYSDKTEENMKNKILSLICIVSLPLLIMSSFFQIFILTALAWVRKKISMSFTLAILGLIVLLVTPYLIYCQKNYKDPFYSINMYSNYYQNIEKHANLMAKNWNELKAGLPTRSDNEHIGGAAYIFQHGIATISQYLMNGIYSITFGKDSRISYFKGFPIIYLFLFLGIISALLAKQYLLIGLILLWSSPIIFIISTSFVFDVRLVCHVVPYLYMLSFQWLCILNKQSMERSI